MNELEIESNTNAESHPTLIGEIGKTCIIVDGRFKGYGLVEEEAITHLRTDLEIVEVLELMQEAETDATEHTVRLQIIASLGTK